MRRIVSLLALTALALSASSQTPTHPKPAAAPANAAAPGAALAPTSSVPKDGFIKDLPVRKVVLYKNGVGYFEHSGQVTGNQRVAIDFTSPQLNDVLQSLTVLDEGGGRIAGVNYNSTTPLSEQLKSLSLGMTDDPTSTELFQALRGQKVEVAGGPGGTISGRLMSIESRSEKVGGESGSTVEKFYLTVVASSGAVRVIELTPALSVRPLDSALEGQLDRYLELLSATHSTGLRHLTLDALGTGQRQLRVSYISEVPVWKSTYRIVFPRTANGNAIVQGWAVVDNTVGADWDNVQLSLVAGAPQSFIQPLSQPLYTRRVEIPIAVGAETTPQTHESGESDTLESPKLAVEAPPSAQGGRSGGGLYGVMGQAKSSNRVLQRQLNGNATDNRNFAAIAALGLGVNSALPDGTYRPSDAIKEGDVSTNAFDDFFEYALTAPVTIHKNESSMVPILQQDLPAEHVTLWSEKEPTPLRAVWLENKSKLTLDSGSFSIFESGEFAGEGLLDPIHPGEKRLLSYAADQALRVRVAKRDSERTLHHVSIKKGVIIETHMDVASVTYSATNSADEERTVLIEHPRHPDDWSLDGDAKPSESAASFYRFKLLVPAHSTTELAVKERGPEMGRVDLNAQYNQANYLIDLGKNVPDAAEKLKPVIDAQIEIAKQGSRINDEKRIEQTASSDETRDRENLTALKGNDAAKRFVDELNRAEDLLQSTRKQIADLEAQKEAAITKLNDLISGLSYEWSVTEK